MNLRKAEKIIKKAISESKELGTKMCISVVDAGGNLIAFKKEDGAWKGSIDISMKKAKTAILFDMPTRIIGTLSQPGESLYGIEHSNNGLITFPGGLPIYKKGKIIGGIGVSGSSVENDEKVAKAGLEV
jgi:uncharacterized protein GlcG (DUF336 family)